MRFRRLGIIALGIGATLASTPRVVEAGLLTDYNLVVIGDRTGSSEVEGRILVGGNLSGTLTNVAFNSGNLGNQSSVDALTVLGNVTTGSGSVQSGRLRVVGSYNNSLNNNTGNSSSYFLDTTTPVPSVAAIANELKNDTASFARLGTASNTGTAAVNNSGKFVLTAPSNSSLAVFNLTADQLNQQNVDQIQLANIGNVTNIVVNVSGANVIDKYTMDGNFQNLRSHIIFNFEDATSLTIQNQFFGSVLAYKASTTANGDIDGGLFVNSFNQTNEVHVPYYNGFIPSADPASPSLVPEPSTIASVGVGLIAAIAFCRRRVGNPGVRGPA